LEGFTRKDKRELALNFLPSLAARTIRSTSAFPIIFLICSPLLVAEMLQELQDGNHDAAIKTYKN
jgi:hypothetical protein